MEFKSIVNTIIRRRWLIASVFLAFFIPLVAAVFIIEPYYSSTAKVWIYRPKASQAFLSSLNLSPSAMETSVSDSERESWIALATARPVIDEVVEELDLKKKRIRYRILDSIPLLRSTLELVGIKLPSGVRKMTHIELTGSSIWRYLWPHPFVEASQYQASDMVEIKATSPGLAAARTLADTVARRFIQTESQRVRGDYVQIRQFLEANIAQSNRQFKQALKELEDFRKREKTVNLDTETSNLLGRIIEARRSQEDVQLNIMRLKASWRDMLDQIKTMPEFRRLGDMEFRSNEAVTNLKNNLLTQYMDLADAATRYGPDHPQRKDTEAKIARTKELLRRELELAVGLDGMFASLREKLVGYLSDLAGYEAQAKVWPTLITAYEKELMQLPGKLSQYAHLNLAVTVAQTLQQSFEEFLGKTSMAQFLEVQNLRLVDPAGEQDPDDSKPSLKINAALGVIGGIVFGLSAAFLMEYLDDSVKTGADLRQIKGPAYLGAVTKPRKRRRAPRRRAGGRRLLPRLRLRPPLAPPEESLRSLAQVLRLTAGQEPLAKVLLSSAQEDEGGVFVAAGLGRGLAREGRKVLLVDADPGGDGRLGLTLGVTDGPGLAECLAGQAKAEQAQRATDTPGLTLVPGGRAGEGRVQSWDPERLRDLVEEMAAGHDMVLLLTPPALISSNALLVCPWVDALVMVVESGRTSRRDLEDCLQVLAPAAPRLVGSVLYQREADIYYRM